jgi:hypothetical protein
VLHVTGEERAASSGVRGRGPGQLFDISEQLPIRRGNLSILTTAPLPSVVVVPPFTADCRLQTADCRYDTTAASVGVVGARLSVVTSVSVVFVSSVPADVRARATSAYVF